MKKLEIFRRSEVIIADLSTHSFLDRNSLSFKKIYNNCNATYGIVSWHQNMFTTTCNWRPYLPFQTRLEKTRLPTSTGEQTTATSHDVTISAVKAQGDAFPPKLTVTLSNQCEGGTSDYFGAELNSVHGITSQAASIIVFLFMRWLA